MMRFKNWLENTDLRSQQQQELQQIWSDTFKALGVGGLSDEDAAQQSLSKITFGDRGNNQHGDTFKGKQAVRKRLENGQIFQRLEKISDPEVRKGIEDARRWLDTQGGEHSANASTTISTLLQKLFGKHYQQFIDQDVPRTDTAKAEVQPQPPKENPTGPMPDMAQGTNSPPMPDTPPPMTQQPQMQGGMQPPKPQIPMPPKPAGAELGLF